LEKSKIFPRRLGICKANSIVSSGKTNGLSKDIRKLQSNFRHILWKNILILPLEIIGRGRQSVGIIYIFSM